MTIRLFLMIAVICSNSTVAQQAKLYPVKAGEIPNEVLPNEAMYTLPAFTTGKAFLRNGTFSVQRFNYNFLQDEMDFISISGDTLAIAEPELLKSVVIDSMIFYYDRGYARVIFKTGEYALAVKQQMVQIADKTRGAYDVATGSSAIKTYSSLSNSNQNYRLQVKKDVLFQQVTSYYIVSAFGNFTKANRKNIQLIFAKKNLAKYQQEHDVNFNKQDDLESLLRFCTE